MENLSQCPLLPDSTLVSLPVSHIMPVGVSWSDCSSDLFELIADKQNIAYVSCFTINPRSCCKYPANIAKITFKKLSSKVKPYIPSAPPMTKLLKIFISGNTADPLHVALCASPGHTHTNCPLTIRICANCTKENNNFFQGCLIYNFQSEVAAFCTECWPVIPTNSSKALRLSTE